MLFKRKKQKLSNEQPVNLGPLLLDLASLLYQDVGKPDGSSEVNVTLEFDKQQRVSAIQNLTVDGKPKMPSPELSASINQMTMQIATLPPINHIKSLVIEIKDGKPQIAPKYMQN